MEGFLSAFSSSRYPEQNEVENAESSRTRMCNLSVVGGREARDWPAHRPAGLFLVLGHRGGSTPFPGQCFKLEP